MRVFTGATRQVVEPRDRRRGGGGVGGGLNRAEQIQGGVCTRTYIICLEKT